MTEQQKNTPSVEEITASFSEFFNKSIGTIAPDSQSSYAITETAERLGLLPEEVITILTQAGIYDDGSIQEEVDPDEEA